MQPRHTNHLSVCLHAAVIAFSIGTLFTGCESEKVQAVKDKVDQGKQDLANAAAAKLEAEILDYAQCQGITNKVVLDGIKDLIKDRDRLSVADLIAAPDGASEMAESARDSGEIGRLAAELLRALAAEEAVSTATDEGLQGRKCHDEIKVPCLLGSAKGAVLCDASDKPVGVQIVASACKLGTFALDGGVSVSPAPGAKGGVRLAFSAFAIDSVRTLYGQVDVGGKLDTGELQIAATSEPSKLLTIKEHGGYDSKLSCGRTITVAAMELTVTATSVSAALDITVQTPGRKVQVKAAPGDLIWTYADKCVCPDKGSEVVATVPRPGGKGDQDTIAVAALFVAGEGQRCRGVKIKITGWPTECSAAETVTSACGEVPRDAIARVSAALASELCVSGS